MQCQHLLVAALVQAALLGSVTAAPILDQSVTSPQGLTGVINLCCAFVAQTYTAGLTGSLAGVKVNVGALVSFSPPPLRVAVRTTQNGIPTNTVLGETLVLSGVSDLSNLVVFPQTIWQIAGQQYAIVVDYPGTPLGAVYSAWEGAPFDVYSGGQLLGLQPEGAWGRSNGWDEHFQTFVEPVPEPNLLGIGIVFLGVALTSRQHNKKCHARSRRPRRLRVRGRSTLPCR